MCVGGTHGSNLGIFLHTPAILLSETGPLTGTWSLPFRLECLAPGICLSPHLQCLDYRCMLPCSALYVGAKGQTHARITSTLLAEQSRQPPVLNNNIWSGQGLTRYSLLVFFPPPKIYKHYFICSWCTCYGQALPGRHSFLLG